MLASLLLSLPLSLTAPSPVAGGPPQRDESGMVRMHGRVHGVSVVETTAERLRLRRLARALFVAARPGLRGCYDDAYGRTPIGAVQRIVELEITSDGAVIPQRLFGGQLVDEAGTRCLAAAFRDVRVPHGLATATRVRVPLSFWFQGASIDRKNSPWPTDPLRPQSSGVPNFSDPWW